MYRRLLSHALLPPVAHWGNMGEKRGKETWKNGNTKSVLTLMCVMRFPQQRGDQKLKRSEVKHFISWVEKTVLS
jgi:hypothetical protein